MQRFTDPTQIIRVAVGQVFGVELPANPTTGYVWQARVDQQRLAWTGDEYQPADEAIGAGGRQIHRFRALESGKSEILLEYRRPWEREVRDTRCFNVEIT